MGKKVTKDKQQTEKQEKTARRIRLTLGIVLVLAAAGLVTGGVLLFQSEQKTEESAPSSDSYAEVISSYYTAVLSSDGQALSQLMAPPEYWNYYLEEYDKTEQDVIDSFAEGCNNTLQEWYETYGTDVQVSYQISSMSQQGEEGLEEWNENMEALLGNDGADMSESVTLEVDLTFTGELKTGSDVVYPTLGKIGDKWYIISEDNSELKGESSEAE